MIIVHIVKPFAAGIAVFVRSLTKALPDDTHIVVPQSKFHRQNARALNGIFHNALAIIMPQIAAK